MQRRVVNPWTWQEQFGFEQAHEVSGAERTLYLSGQTSMGENGELLHAGDMAGQIGQVIDNIDTVLGAADMTLADITRITIYTTDVDEFIANANVLGRLNAAGCKYASTLIGVTRLAFPDLLVEIEVTAAA